MDCRASPGRLLQPTAFKYFQISTPFLRVEFETIKRANTLCIGRSVSIVQQAPTVKHGLIIYIWYLTGLCVVYSGSLLQNTAPGGELSIRSLPFCRLLKPRCSAGIAPDCISSADSTSFLCLSFRSRYPANHNINKTWLRFSWRRFPFSRIARHPPQNPCRLLGSLPRWRTNTSVWKTKTRNRK